MNLAATTELPYVRQRHLLRGTLGPLFANQKPKTASDEKLGVNSSTQIGEVVYALVSPMEQQWPSAPPSLYGATWPQPELEQELTRHRYIPEPGATSNSAVVEELTTSGVVTRAISRALDALLERSLGEHFEDGIDSDLSVGIRLLVRNYGDEFPKVFDSRMKEREISSKIIAEILHTLGSIVDSVTKDWRFATLVESLKSRSPSVRDAAAVGLAYLDDIRAAPFLHEAIERETSQSFKDDLRSILEQLGA